MRIVRASCLDGAARASGLAIVIDVFRASNTLLALFESGVERVIPVASLDEAFALKRSSPELLLVGERKRLPPPGFDFGNSPCEIARADLTGRSAVFTTSAGSRGIAAARGADRTLVGCFANARALVDCVLAGEPDLVTVIAMGFEAEEKAEEDEACARHLARLLRGEPGDFDAERRAARASPAAAELRDIGREEDVAHCLRDSVIDIVPEFVRERGAIIDRASSARR